MPLGDHAPRLNFLKDSAGALSGVSPSTAAYLMNLHHGILRDDSRPVNHRQLETSCGGCGSIRRPECTKTIHVRQKKGKRVGAKGPAGDGAVIYQCLRCHRRTVKPSRKEAIRSSVPAKATSTAALASTTPSTSTTAAAGTESGPKTADNVNSKKRAKARKQGGLQALMATKKQSNNGSSLDLFDFLQG